MLLFIVPLAIWLWNQASDIASGVGDFLRNIPSLLAPKPTPLGTSFTPPFTGGQCAFFYLVTYTLYKTDLNGVESIQEQGLSGAQGAIQDIVVSYGSDTPNAGKTSLTWSIKTSNGNVFAGSISSGSGTGFASGRGVINSVRPRDGQIDSCGNVGNPAPPPSIPDGDLFKPNNPTISDNNDVINPAAIVLAPALPLVLVPLISSAIAAALAAARAAADALEAIKKIAEALEGLSKLWDKLKEFLDEWEKNRPKKRDIVRQTYGQIVGDGALDFFSSNNKKAQAIQLDIIITSIPIGIGKYFGSLSPSRYRYKELGYIAFYSTNQGILETHSLQFKRSTLQIPELAVGFIYHLGLDEAIRGYAFGTFSIEKE